MDLRLGLPAAPPDATALTDGETSLTYADLHHLVAHEATALRRDGVGPGALVPLPSPERRTAATIVRLLAILAAGAAFTPVPPGTESGSMIGEIVADRTAWPGHLSPLPAPAYVLSTSGSTGPAKHTVVTREGLRGVFGGLYARFHGHLPPRAIWTQAHPLTFGFSICEVLGSLTFGGTLALVEREDPVTFAALSRRLAGEPGPQVVCLTPSELSVLMSTEDTPLPSHLVLSGEPAHRAPLREVFTRAGAAPPVVVNTYAATETCGQITADLVTPARLDAVLAGHVGHPLTGVDVVLLGHGDVPVPTGDTATEGEIAVRGATVSAGYLHPAAHEGKFTGTGAERAFRTGDRGRWAPDGGLVVTGRAERRVKLAGRWTALDAIERALTEDGCAAEAVAAVEEYAVGGATAGRLLVAVVPAGAARAGTGSGAGAGARAARAETAARVRRRVVRLLDGPVTVRTVVCEAIPRTAHGKTDLAALRRGPRAAPREPGVAGTVRGVWTELLGAGFSVDTNLFESGVDSLGVVAAAARLTEVLRREVSPAFLLDHPRIALQIESLTDDADRTAQGRPPVRQTHPGGSAADRRRAARRQAGTPVPPVHTEGVMQ
ncbi:non-ribosomal peptide synthetase [Streptomyces sp. NEAU-S77]|uniref:non-ribosomal peptide synthetase n=1 Tax=Streptomyces sp. NEAU-S77 TaxID=3411033 RepID=UPI003BA0879D